MVNKFIPKVTTNTQLVQKGNPSALKPQVKSPAKWPSKFHIKSPLYSIVCNKINVTSRVKVQNRNLEKPIWLYTVPKQTFWSYLQLMRRVNFFRKIPSSVSKTSERNLDPKPLSGPETTRRSLSIILR